MYMYMYVCIYIYIHIYICTHIYMYKPFVRGFNFAGLRKDKNNNGNAIMDLAKNSFLLSRKTSAGERLR